MSLIVSAKNAHRLRNNLELCIIDFRQKKVGKGVRERERE